MGTRKDQRSEDVGDTGDGKAQAGADQEIVQDVVDRRHVGRIHSPIVYVIPIKTVSEANGRDHWSVKARRVRSQRDAGKIHTLAAAQRQAHRHATWLVLGQALAVTVTRIAPGTLDSDNLSGSQKAMRDGIADALGIDDRDPRVTWSYAQRRGKPREYAVEIVIAPIE